MVHRPLCVTRTAIRLAAVGTWQGAGEEAGRAPDGRTQGKNGCSRRTGPGATADSGEAALGNCAQNSPVCGLFREGLFCRPPQEPFLSRKQHLPSRPQRLGSLLSRGVGDVRSTIIHTGTVLTRYKNLIISQKSRVESCSGIETGTRRMSNVTYFLFSRIIKFSNVFIRMKFHSQYKHKPRSGRNQR